MPIYTQVLRIATRQSPLALWQANYVKQALQERYPQLTVELVKLLTQGDKITAEKNFPVGKSLFVKELQNALLTDQADIAVHSVKDLSVFPCPGVELVAICEREDPRDVLVANHHDSLENLPPHAVIGTSSPRRASLLHHQSLNWVIKVLRGNIGTRLDKLDAGHYNGIILAAAGLKRLQLTHRIIQYLDPKTFVPAIGQGALGIECRNDNKFVREQVVFLNHFPSYCCVTAERAFNHHLGGDCYTPIGAYATYENNGQLHLHAMIANKAGSKVLREKKDGLAQQAESLGRALAEQMLTTIMQQGYTSWKNFVDS